MTMMRRLAPVCVALGLSLGCGGNGQTTNDKAGKTNEAKLDASKPDEPRPTPAPNDDPPPTPEGIDPSPPPQPLVGLELGPAENADAQARADAVLGLLTNGQAVTELPLLDTDPGATFNPQLAKQLEPLAFPTELQPKRTP